MMVIDQCHNFNNVPVKKVHYDSAGTVRHDVHGIVVLNNYPKLIIATIDKIGLGSVSFFSSERLNIQEETPMIVDIMIYEVSKDHECFICDETGWIFSRELMVPGRDIAARFAYELYFSKLRPFHKLILARYLAMRKTREMAQ